MLALINMLCTEAPADGPFVDHGVGAPAAESRGVLVCRDGAGTPLAICLSCDSHPRGWLLVTNLDTGETTQHFFTEGVPNSPPFASLLSADGNLYTFAGKTFLQFNPTTREWGVHGVPAESEDCYCGSAMADGPGGLIFAGSYPGTHLVSCDPKTGAVRDYGRMDPAEFYVLSLAFDDAGWAYGGIGTARAGISALNPATGEVALVCPEDQRKTGSGSVYAGVDGKVYGQANGHWYRLYQGKGEEIAADQKAAAKPSGAIDWGRISGTVPGGPRVVRYDLPGRWLEVEDPQTKQKRRFEFTYEAGGADITSLTAGPDGRVFGSSAHPMLFFDYDPGADRLQTHGPIPKLGGGNFCAMATQQGKVFGAAYCGGYLYRYDPQQPWTGGEGDAPNPKLVAQFEEDITRPRACLAHPDGKSVIFGGFADYGLCGGGLGIYDLDTDTATLLKHTEVIENQSTIALKALPDGNLVGGTSIQTPGGGHELANEGVLYALDWKTRTVVFQTVPVPGAGEVFSLEVGPAGLVYGMASGSRFFVFDPQKREVIHREDLSRYGGLPRPALQMGPDGGLYAILSGAILRIDPMTFAAEKLATPPVSIQCGLAITGGRLYFGARAHLWSYELPK